LESALIEAEVISELMDPENITERVKEIFKNCDFNEDGEICFSEF
jgi:Ca2+-binding EF-hand superfamily protein